MIVLPYPSPPAADLRSPGRFLLGLAVRQRRTLLASMIVQTVWLLCLGTVPFVIGSTLDAGIVGRDGSAIRTGCLVLLGLGLLGAALSALGERLRVSCWLQAGLTSAQLIGHHVADQGEAVMASTSTGEVLEATGTDSDRIGNLLEALGRAGAAAVAYVAVSVAVLWMDLQAGVWVVLGVPVLCGLIGLLLRPLQARQLRRREADGQLTALGADTVAGLRVLRGIGGEARFVARYAERSQQVRAAGVRVATPHAALESAAVLLPGIFVVCLIWVGAHGVQSGRLTTGELLSLYGTAAFMRLPLEAATEGLYFLASARVGAARTIQILRRRTSDPGAEPQRATQPESFPPPRAGLARTVLDGAAGRVLEDPDSGVVLIPGELTAVVCAAPEISGALADRLGRFAPGTPPRLGGVPLDRFSLDDVRAAIQVSDAEPRLFSGSLRTQLDPYQQHSTEQLLAALEVADAGDVLAALSDGLESPVDERGRNFSGGQRQRLALARAVLARPEVLVLVEPTSAVDAHTERRLAQRLRVARRGRTTLIATASPLVLDLCDRVVLLDESGRACAQGTHQQLLRTNSAYRDVVTRGEEA